jgi:hypothetical protein
MPKTNPDTAAINVVGCNDGITEKGMRSIDASADNVPMIVIFLVFILLV